MDIIIFIIIGIIIGGVTAFSICWSGKVCDKDGEGIQKAIKRLDTIISDIKKTI